MITFIAYAILFCADGDCYTGEKVMYTFRNMEKCKVRAQRFLADWEGAESIQCCDPKKICLHITRERNQLTTTDHFHGKD